MSTAARSVAPRWPCPAARSYQIRRGGRAGVDRLRTFPDEELSDTEGQGCSLGIFALHGHEAHRRPQGRFTDRLRIRGVILLPLHETLDVDGRDQPHVMGQLADLAALEMAPPQASIAATLDGSWPKNSNTCARRTSCAEPSTTVIISDMTALL